MGSARDLRPRRFITFCPLRQRGHRPAEESPYPTVNVYSIMPASRNPRNLLKTRLERISTQ